MVWGSKNDPKLKLWIEKSAPKIDKNSRSKKGGSKIEKGITKIEMTGFEPSDFGAEGSLGTTNLMTRQSKTSSLIISQRLWAEARRIIFLRNLKIHGESQVTCQEILV